MLQAIMKEPGRIDFIDIPVPEIEDEQVLVKIKKIGICGSDIHVYYGKHPYTSYPVVQGHEVSGQVVKTGFKVLNFTIGDKVTIQPQIVCGKCYPCRHNSYHICDDLKVMGFQTTGMAAEFFAVDSKKVVKLPENINYDHGAMVEPLAVAVHALSRGGDVQDKKIIVLGGGPIGNLVAQAARGLGADKVMITDISNYRLDIARQCGIDYCVNPTSVDLKEEVLDKFGREKADLILECVGVNDTIESGITIARKGSDIIVVGVFSEKANIDLGLVQDRELRIIGTLMYKESDYKTAINLIDEDKVKLEPLITCHFDFQDYLQAYQYIEEKRDRVMKVIINLS